MEKILEMLEKEINSELICDNNDIFEVDVNGFAGC